MPDCYRCKHQHSIPGDAHIQCVHPEVKQNQNPFAAMADTLAGKNDEAIKKLNIKANPIGVKKGWFLWPGNFDPVWLISCNGFEAK